MVKSSIPNAFTIAVLAAIESLLSCVVADGMINGKHRSDTELVAQGLGNTEVFLQLERSQELLPISKMEAALRLLVWSIPLLWSSY